MKDKKCALKLTFTRRSLRLYGRYGFFKKVCFTHSEKKRENLLIFIEHRVGAVH